jgi:hypothetical protein
VDVQPESVRQQRPDHRALLLQRGALDTRRVSGLNVERGVQKRGIPAAQREGLVDPPLGEATQAAKSIKEIKGTR